MKLKFYLDEKGKKQYTLKETIDGKSTEDAHYKFVKIRSEASRTASAGYQDSQ
jgi:hypothetical protein